MLFSTIGDRFFENGGFTKAYKYHGLTVKYLIFLIEFIILLTNGFAISWRKIDSSLIFNALKH